MRERKNIFRIARRGHSGDEDQLTELLAFLFQQEPGLLATWLRAIGVHVEVSEWHLRTQQPIANGRLDLELSVPGRALAVVESKLGTTTDFSQITKYIRYAKTVAGDELRAIVLLTQSHEPWPVGVEEEAGEDIRLILCRWQKLGDVIREHGDVLGQDFVEMLEGEGLVTPAPLTTDDWMAWHRGSEVLSRIWTLLNELRAVLETSAPAFKSASWGVGTGWIYRTLMFEDVHLGLGFAPNFHGLATGLALKSGTVPTHLGDDPLVFSFIYDPALPGVDCRQAAEAAISRASARLLVTGWSQYPIRVERAADILQAPHFDQQLGEAARFVVETAALFQRVGYAANVPIAIQE
ncbi:MAG: hypothetical protein H0U03_10370 [Actinobacteria bacterium]|nr:hypothetical protein [Actinomycetota bacterium]